LGIAWGANEDELLTSTVLDFCNRGISIADAFLSAAKKLNRTTEACSGRWYEKFQEMYKAEIKSIKKNVSRTNEYVGPWEWYDDEKFMKLMVQYLIQGVGVTEAIELSAKALGRSTSSSSTRWYSYIIKRNKLTIENLIKEGKSQMAQTTQRCQASNWTNEEKYQLFKIVKSGAEAGQKMKDVIAIAAHTLKKEVKEVHNLWYNYVRKDKEFVSRFDAERLGVPQPQIVEPQQLRSEWTDEEKALLGDTVLQYVKDSKAMVQAFKFVSEQTGRTLKAVDRFWDKNLKYNFASELKRIHEARRNGALKTLQPQPAKTPTTLVSQADDLLSLVQKLVKRNEELEGQNQALKMENQELKNELTNKAAEAAMAEEFKKNYEEVLNAVERARKFIVDSELSFDSKASNN